MTGSVHGVVTTVLNTTLDIGSTRNANGDLLTNQIMLFMIGDVELASLIAQELAPNLHTRLKKETAGSLITKVGEPQSEQGEIPEIQEGPDIKIRRRNCEWEQKRQEEIQGWILS